MPRRARTVTAFVLSGGGIRGPLQVGALQSLLEHGIIPDMVTGTSAGALNAGFLAAHGVDLQSIAALKAAWCSATKNVVYPGNIFTIAGRIVEGADGLFPTDGMRRLVEQHLPPGIKSFGQLKIPCYLTSVDLRSRKLFLFGEDPNGSLVDGMLASSYIPVLQPPLEYHGRQLVDGGVLACVPSSVAMDKGANVIYAVNLGSGEELNGPAKGMVDILMRTLDTWLSASLFQDLSRAASDPNIELHHIQISDFHGLPFNDFAHIEDQFVAGKAAMDRYLDHPAPLTARPLEAAAEPLEEIPGAREYRPAWLR
jgi:NTE family protein